MGLPANVLVMNLSPDMARKMVKEIAADSSRVMLTTHAKQRMRLRKISMTQVLCCLTNGHVVEGPARDASGNWKFNMTVISAGEVITTTVALDNKGAGNYAVVITVFL